MRTLSVSLLLPLLLALPAAVLPDGAAATHDEVIMPPALSPGGTVALVTPARPQREELITRVKEGLQANGYNVVLAPNLTTQWGYLAGTDEERAEALMEAWRNPDVDAIFSLIGGYGTTRILDKLDYDVIRENPKVFTGLSDITGLHSAIHMKTGLVTFHSPNTSWVLARVEE